MQQLTGLDQLFLTINSKTTNSVLGGLILYDTPGDGQPVPDEAFMRRRLAERIRYIPPMHRVLVDVPFGLDHPYLGTADRIDVGAHLRTVRLEAPGTQEQLADEVSLLMSANLTPGRPMWDLTVFEGLADGGVAHLLRIDHAVIDGSSFPPMWDLLSDEPQGQLDADVMTDWPQPLFGRPEMLVRGLLGAASYPFRVARLSGELVSWAAQRLYRDHLTTLPQMTAKVLPGELGMALASLVNFRQRANGEPDVTPMVPTLWPPSTPINGRLSSRRKVVFATMSLSDAKAVGKAFDTTLNNVVVAAATGAIRRFLQDRDGLPQRPLIACCPISLRTGKEELPWANILFMMFAPVPTNLSDPADRMRAVTDNLTLAKHSFDNLPTHLMRHASSLLPGQMYALPIQLLSRAPHRFAKAPWNFVVSNVKGSSRPAHMNGLRVRAYAPISFMTVGGGINITLQSHEDTLAFGFIGAEELVGDMWPMTRYLSEELELLKQAAAELPHPTAALTENPDPPRSATTSRVRAVQIVS